MVKLVIAALTLLAARPSMAQPLPDLSEVGRAAQDLTDAAKQERHRQRLLALSALEAAAREAAAILREPAAYSAEQISQTADALVTLSQNPWLYPKERAHALDLGKAVRSALRAKAPEEPRHRQPEPTKAAQAWLKDFQKRLADGTMTRAAFALGKTRLLAVLDEADRDLPAVAAPLRESVSRELDLYQRSRGW